MPRHGAVVGVITGAVDLLIFQHFVPAAADIKSAPPFDKMIEGSERTALFVGIGFNALVAGYVRSWDTFIIASAILVAGDFAIKHANAFNPATGKMAPAGMPSVGNEGNSQAYPMADYSMQDNQAA
jgi:Na+-transporting NADH:ubiquinone oxidoreductase subunit NqrB